MFKIELLTQSSLEKKFNEYNFFWEDYLSIGFNEEDDLILELNEQLNHSLLLSIYNNDLYICLSNQTNQKTFKVNNKKFTGKKKINIGDILSLHKYQFKVLDYKKSKKVDLKEKYRKLIKNDPIYETLIKGLQEELITVEGIIKSEKNI